MISLLDANVLIALMDAAHVHHSEAQMWLDSNLHLGWATCSITQNACLRIISQSTYSNRQSIYDIARSLESATNTSEHVLFGDEVRLCDSQRFDLASIASPKYLTDIYLLGLAVANGGRLVTFDQNIPISAVVDARPEHLVVLRLTSA